MVVADGYLAKSAFLLLFVNGLAFFAMGLSIALQTRQTMAFRPSKSLWLLAAYGLTASLSNWLYLLQPVDTNVALFLKLIRLIVFVLGASLLLQFGLRLLFADSARQRWGFAGCSLALVLAVSVVLSTPASLQDRLTQATAWAGLLLYLPGILSTSLGFYGQSARFRQEGSSRLSRDCTGVAVALACDAIALGGLALSILLTGLPLRLVMFLSVARTLTTLAIVYFAMRVLYVGEVERRNETDRAIHDRLRAQEKALLAQREICQEIRQWSTSMTTMVRTVSSAISQPLDIGEIMDIVLSETLKLTGLQQGGIFIVDDKEQMLYQVAHQGIPTWFSDALSPLKVGDRLTGSVAKSGEMLIVDDIEQDPRASIPNSKDVHRFFVGVPLVAGGKVFGVMDLFHPTKHQLSEQQIALLAATGQQLGAAIETSRLYDELRGKAALEERWRLSRELHDDLLQVLGYLNLRSKVTQALLPEAINTGVTDGLKDIERTTAQTYNDLRASIMGLRVELPANGDFVPALASYIQEFGNRNHLHIVLDTCAWTAPALPRETQVQITRVVQEALTNVRRHADASCAWVIFAAETDAATIRVKDNGRGFVLSQVGDDGESHLGLQTMQERAESVGAALEILSQPGHGTEVRVTLPLKS